MKGYLPPRTINSNTLVVTTSISGNTEETINILDAACKQNCKTISFSSGGKIEEYCKENKREFRKIEQIHSPRASFVNYLCKILKILNPILPIDENEINESISHLKQLKKIISLKIIF